MIHSRARAACGDVRRYDLEGRDGVENLSDFDEDEDSGDDVSATQLPAEGSVAAGAPACAFTPAAGAASAPAPAPAPAPSVVLAPSAMDLAEAVAEAVRRTEERAAKRYERALAALLRDLDSELTAAAAADRAHEAWTGAGVEG